MGNGERRTALVTGGNRGIGLETCRRLSEAGLRVVLTARDRELGERAAEQLDEVRFEQLDVADQASVDACCKRLAEAGTAVDVLVNNAGILLDEDVDLLSSDPAVIEENVRVHMLGSARTCIAFVPGMVQRGYGRVVNLVSDWGSWSAGIPGPAGYALGKAGERAVTLKLAREVRGDVKVNALDPGWVATRMGGSGAERSARQAADAILRLATLPADGPNGEYFSDGRHSSW
jgi:NAD(P)-dependent dehydrogenase (short-subunit alcohol dehydrogenase family)